MWWIRILLWSRITLWPRSCALKPGLIRFFFHLKQCFSLTNSSRIPPNHPNSSGTIPSERGQWSVYLELEWFDQFDHSSKWTVQITQMLDQTSDSFHLVTRVKGRATRTNPKIIKIRKANKQTTKFPEYFKKSTKIKRKVPWSLLEYPWKLFKSQSSRQYFSLDTHEEHRHQLESYAC